MKSQGGTQRHWLCACLCHTCDAGYEHRGRHVIQDTVCSCAQSTTMACLKSSRDNSKGSHLGAGGCLAAVPGEGQVSGGVRGAIGGRTRLGEVAAVAEPLGLTDVAEAAWQAAAGPPPAAQLIPLHHLHVQCHVQMLMSATRCTVASEQTSGLGTRARWQVFEQPDRRTARAAQAATCHWSRSSAQMIVLEDIVKGRYFKK